MPTGSYAGLLSMLAFLGSSFCIADDQLCLPVMDAGPLLKQRGLPMAGKTVVITGGDSGIGYGTAMGLASAGAKLIMLGFHLDKVNI
jgi:hypothetical protein